MSDALKMTKLDFYTVKSQIRGNTIALLVITLTFAFMGSSFGTLFFTAAWYASLSANTIFMTQEKNRLERLYISLSLGGNDFVRGRYLFYYANYMASMLVASVLGAATALVTGRALCAQDFVGAACDSLLIFTVLVCVQIPVCMRLPYSKAQYWCLLILMAIVAAFMFFSAKAFPAWDNNTAGGRGLMNAVCVAACVAILLVSYAVAKRCYHSRRRIV